MPVPKRILILGPNGSGKSTLARRIGERLGIPVVHLDAIYWNPGWVPTEVGRFRERMAEAAGCDTWVMEGNYTSHLDLRLPRADAVIWLDLPRYVYFPRAIWRSIRNYGRERDDVGRGTRSNSICIFQGLGVDLPGAQSRSARSTVGEPAKWNPAGSFLGHVARWRISRTTCLAS